MDFELEITMSGQGFVYNNPYDGDQLENWPQFYSVFLLVFEKKNLISFCEMDIKKGTTKSTFSL